MIHVLFGRNAQGKTNILEGIYYLSHLRSFRTLKTGSLIEHDEQAFSIECLVERKTRLEDLRIYVEDHKSVYSVMAARSPLHLRLWES